MTLLPVALIPSVSQRAGGNGHYNASRVPSDKALKMLDFHEMTGGRAARSILAARGNFCRVLNAALTIAERGGGRRTEDRDHAHPGNQRHRHGRRGFAPPRRSASGTFSLETESQARTTGAPAGVRNIGGIDALLALQGVEEPGERRRKAVKRGRGALDALDALKLGLLSGTLDTAALARLKSAGAGPGRADRRPGLDTVLAEIALRVEVELAKVGMPGAGPPADGLSRGSTCPNRAAAARFPCRCE